jgi:hypothetical protein
MGNSNGDNDRSTSNTLYSEKIGLQSTVEIVPKIVSLGISKKYIVQYIFSEIKMCLS